MLGARLISGVAVALFQHTLGRLVSAAKRPARVSTRPMHGTHYRMSRDPRYGGHCNRQALDILCPDGRWRRFVWTTNHTSPLCEDGRKSLVRLHGGGRGQTDRERLARQVFYMSDKFIGPTSMGPTSAPDEGSLRDTPHIGLYVLDPDCRETNAQLDHPWHGRDYCAILDDPSVDSSWADRADETRLLPCYDTVAGRSVRLKRPGVVSFISTCPLWISAVAMTVAIALAHFVLLPTATAVAHFVLLGWTC